jgi:hypothetical protein
MKLTRESIYLIIEKEDGDKTIYTETAFFHAVKKILNSQGHDLIKKNMEKDGHMMSAPYYLRDRKWKYCFYDGEYAIRDIAKEYRCSGKARLLYHEL